MSKVTRDEMGYRDISPAHLWTKGFMGSVSKGSSKIQALC